MARDTANHQQRIVRGQNGAVGKPMVKGTSLTVERVLASLAASLNVDELVRRYPELTHDDVRAVLTYAHDQLQSREDEPAAPISNGVSPQEFYAQVTGRPDVASLMRRLARQAPLDQ